MVNEAFAASLFQKDTNNKYVLIGLASRKQVARYNECESGAACVMQALQYFESSIGWQHIIIQSVHGSLKYILQGKIFPHVRLAQ